MSDSDEENDSYRINHIYKRRLMNAKGYVLFWEEHVKKLPDEFAIKMYDLSKKILEITEKEVEKNIN